MRSTSAKLVGAVAVMAVYVAAVGAVSPALGQENQGKRDTSEPPSGGQTANAKKANAVQVGAGTDNATTTGFSGPQKGGAKKPSKPGQSLCNSYQGAAHQSCLETVLRTAPKAQ